MSEEGINQPSVKKFEEWEEGRMEKNEGLRRKKYDDWQPRTNIQVTKLFNENSIFLDQQESTAEFSEKGICI